MADPYIKGQWNELKGRVKERWGELTNDDLDRMEGRRDQLVGKIQERYGIAREAAEKQVNDWASTVQAGSEQEPRRKVG